MFLHPKNWDESPLISDHHFDYSTGPIDHDVLSCEYVDSITIKDDVSLRILQLNIRGIIGKQSDLRRLLLEQKIGLYWFDM